MIKSSYSGGHKVASLKRREAKEEQPKAEAKRVNKVTKQQVYM